jgi:TorA maturation chaperone TorD
MSAEWSAPGDLAVWFAIAGRALASPDAAGGLREIAESLTAQRKAGTGVREELAALWAELPADRQEAHREYVRLFLSPGSAPCPLWQSAHGEEPQLMGPSHHSAIEWYRSEGIEPGVENEPADHASLLLVFFAHLLESGAPPEWRQRYWREHLAWLPKVLARVESETRLPFYARLARVTRERLEEAGASFRQTPA